MQYFFYNDDSIICAHAKTTWTNQLSWADGLSVTFGNNTYTDWRLPTTVNGPVISGFDGTTTAGYNITSSEMGYLFLHFIK